ncbi:putative polyketide synthase [Rosellinia necatrix]|uniref:Putative polyketide synthase n=1 Tax=Rosellinia necatrix TaxID=77044 RepID=A0A1S8A7X4_ROSNE|nr:putative polyketide synthase [Rosellinia necatrix]
MVSKDPEMAPRMAITGTFSSILPNRVSWFFDLLGPSVHIDTACSSSLVAIDLACQSLASGDASMALVTGSNLILGPDGFLLLSNLGFLSPDSKSYSFDHRANGYARGEGVIALVLKPLRDAVKDGDMIRAVIRSTGTNQDGRTPSLTQPSPESQEELIRHVYKKANLSFADTRYVEAHGTGTPVGDPIEMKAIGKVFRPYRSPEEPLYVGSIKANIGHLEGCSGLAGIIKSIMILEKGIIVPNALFQRPNDNIDVEFYHTVVPTKPVTWPSNGLRRVSVNSFGFGGTNTHVILDDAYHYLRENELTANHCTFNSYSSNILNGLSYTSIDKPKVNGVGKQFTSDNKLANSTNGVGRNGVSYVNGARGSHTIGDTSNTLNGNSSPIPSGGYSNGIERQTRVSYPSIRSKLLVWSAADEKALQRMLQQYEGYINTTIAGNAEKLKQLAYTLASRRSHMLWRTFSVVSDDTAVTGVKLLTSKTVRTSAEVGLAFVFTGQGAQYIDMGLELMQYPIYETTLRQIDALYRDLGCDWSIFDQIHNPENIDRPEYSQPLSTALQIALVELLKSFGVSPKAVVGHSSGEIAAAYTKGSLSLHSAAKISYFRGKLAGRLKTKASSTGAMISVNLPHDQVKDYLKATDMPGFEDLVQIACINSPLNCTLSGPEHAINAIKKDLDEKGIFAQMLKTGVAYHSSFMSIIAGEYLSLVGTLEVGNTRSTIPMISTVTGSCVRSSVLATGQYWVDNLVSPVRFSDAIQIATQKASTLKVGLGVITDLVEIGPHAALKRPIQDTVTQVGNRKKIRYASALYRSKNGVESILELLGHLFCHGHEFNVSEANGVLSSPIPSFLVDCPEYPFDRSHVYWSESRLSRDFRLREPVAGDFLGWRFHDWNPLEPRWRNLWSVETTPWIGDHVVSNTIIYPAAGMLVMAMEAAQEIAFENRIISGYYFKEAHFLSPIVVKETWENKTETMLHLRPIQQPYEKQSTWSDIRLFARHDGRWNECFRATIQIEYEDQHAEVDNGIEKQLTDNQTMEQFETAVNTCTAGISSREFYKDSEEHDLKYGEWFQLLENIRWDGKATSLARVSVTPKHQASLIHPAVLDAAFHVLRVSITKGLTAASATHVPMSLHDGWFSASGWQASHTSSIRYLSIADGGASRGTKEGAIYALSDDNSILCRMKRLVTAKVSKEDEFLQPHKKLLYGVEWQPQFSLLDTEQLQKACGDDTFSKDETDIVNWHEKLTFVLNTSLSKTLKQLTASDRLKIPASLARHASWMELQVQQIPPSQVNTDINDEDLGALLEEIEVLNPPWKLFTAVVRQLKRILVGEIDPLSVIFDSNLAEIFYADMFKSICDHRLQRIIELASHENPQLRILEVGAGTGGMTSHILSALINLERQTGGLRFSNYTYTDVSPTFFENAKSKWHEVGERMIFKTLDLERAIEDQGFELGSYDLVIAGSVLHATTDLGATIRNVHKALKHGGRMILLEAVAPEKVITNFAFGLAPGWWNCQEEWRATSPAIVEDQWHECLRANGFSGNDLCLRDFTNESCHIFSIILTTAEAEQKLDDYTPQGRFTVIVDSSSDTQRTFVASLEEALAPQLGSERLDTIALSQLEDACVADDDIVISLLETDKPFLATITPDDFQNFQRLVKTAKNLLWVTGTRSDDPQYALYGIAPGFFRSIRTEAIEKHLVLLSIERSGESTASLACHVSKVLKAAFEASSAEVEYVVRHGELMTGRVVEESSLNSTMRSLIYPQLQDKPWSSSALQLTVRTPGDLESLEFVEDPTHTTPLGPRDVEIAAKAWGLNFRDVYVALGRLDDGDLGGDCAGIVTRIGSACESGIQPGDRVCMISPGCMRAYPRALESSVLKLPDDISFEAAASMVAPGITAYYSLVDVARLRKGEKILIHSAAGSTGQIAMWIAKLRGAEIFATVGFDEKKKLLMEKFNIPEDRIFYSRNTSFAQGIMRVTNGRGVDVVLNSLSGDGLRASWECIAPYGRFIEIGKADIMANSSLPMACFAKNVTFSAVDLVHLSQSDEELTARLLRSTLDLLEQGAQHPFPLHIYPVSKVEEAFRFLQSGKNTGRILIGVDSSAVISQRVLENKTWSFDTEASYVIAGGFGGLGRAIIRWMVDRGARHLIILSRSGPVSKAAVELVSSLSERGVILFTPTCDASSISSLGEALEECKSRAMPPIRGCINAAMVLQDAVFENMSYAKWALTINSKVQSSWNLHNLLPGDLDFFVLLSSLAGICGTVAQSNYAGGCSAQDALTRFRTANGQKAISFDVGWMRNIGIIAEKESYQRNRQQAADMQQIDDTELLALLDIYCDPSLPLLSVAKSQVLIGLLTPADFLLQGQTPPQMHDRPLFGSFAHVVGQTISEQSISVTENPGILFRLANETDERIQIVIRALAVKLARAMSITPDDVEPSKPLSSYGVDSLMAVELRNYIGREFQATVAVFDIMGGVPISSIGDLVVERSTTSKGQKGEQQV